MGGGVNAPSQAVGFANYAANSVVLSPISASAVQGLQNNAGRVHPTRLFESPTILSPHGGIGAAADVFPSPHAV